MYITSHFPTEMNLIIEIYKYIYVHIYDILFIVWISDEFVIIDVNLLNVISQLTHKYQHDYIVLT